ncbi:MAG TPA: hypothetical protein PKX72_08070 [Chitinophagales bacterium]|nr:hypothetical protein [Chitinophagales bacterium]
MLSQKRWNFLEADEAIVEALQKQLNIHPVLCKLLVLRGITTFEEAKDFFRPNLSQLHDPFLMKDMDKAITRIEQAIQNNENILIYGDYDVEALPLFHWYIHFSSKFIPDYTSTYQTDIQKVMAFLIRE